jgi:hypothetical protein
MASWEVAMKLNVKALALASGLTWGFGVFLLTWWIMAFEGPTHDLMLIGHVYRGYDISAAGSVIGLVWGFADGMIGGAVFAWLYNLISKSVSGSSTVSVEVEETPALSRL